MAQRRRVLVTGASGLVGGVLRRALSSEYSLSGLDRAEVPELDCLVADATDLEAMRPAFEGIDTVIDLAANPASDLPWEAVRDNNIPCTYNALEAARLSGVRRLIFASSNHVTGMYELDHPYSAIVAGRYDGLDPRALPRLTADMPIRPDGPYGIGKAFGEAAGRFFADEHGLSVICLRIGTVNREGRPTMPRQFATLLSHRDLSQLVTRSIEASEAVRFAVFYGVSGNTWRFWDIEDSRRAVGYEPVDDAEQFREG